MIENVNHLLTQVGLITRKYDELAALTGERFNIFSIMSMESNEVYTHSAFLGELLHANGSHDLKYEPLQLFLETLEDQFKSGDKKLFAFDIKDSWSVTEEYQGIIDVDATSGGRIDIVIKNKSGPILLIENKIYAGEQGNQLLRYNTSYPKTPILFLTINGHQPNSCGNLKENEVYFCISYEKTIITWLEKCLRAATTLPMLREVIRQYIFLIKKLTNQTTNKKMEKDITDALLHNVKAAFEISNNITNLKLALCEKLEDDLRLFAEQTNAEFDSDYKKNGYVNTKDTGFSFIPREMKDLGLSIRFLFDRENFVGFWAALGGIDRVEEVSRKKLIESLKEKGYTAWDYNVWKYIFEGAGTAEDWAKFKNGKMGEEIKSMFDEIRNGASIVTKL